MYRNCRNQSRSCCCSNNGADTVTMNIYNQTPLLDYYELISLMASSCSCGCSSCCTSSCGCGCSE